MLGTVISAEDTDRTWESTHTPRADTDRTWEETDKKTLVLLEPILWGGREG